MHARFWCIPLFLEPRLCGTASSGVLGAPNRGAFVVGAAGGRLDAADRRGGGSPAEDNCFVEFDVDCDADLILGYDWLRAHDLAFLYASDAVCLCAKRGCTSDRRVRLDLVSAAPASLALRLSQADATALLRDAGLEVPLLGRPSLWTPPGGGRPAAVAALAAAAAAVMAWTEDTLAGLAEVGHTLTDGTELLIGHVTFAAAGRTFTMPPDTGNPSDFAALAHEYADVLAGPPPGLPPDRGPAFELRIETGSRPMPRPRPVKR
jgi:hypothetical protein